MGVYDFFKGQCPHCDLQIGHVNGIPCGDIQTKLFIKNSFLSFRSFYPGDIMPDYPPLNFIEIGPTTCCKKMIFVAFYGKRLLNYAKTASECATLIRQHHIETKYNNKMEQQQKEYDRRIEANEKDAEEMKRKQENDSQILQRQLIKTKMTKSQKRHKRRSKNATQTSS